jgi:hypothetical protein
VKFVGKYSVPIEADANLLDPWKKRRIINDFLEILRDHQIQIPESIWHQLSREKKRLDSVGAGQGSTTQIELTGVTSKLLARMSSTSQQRDAMRRRQ